MFLQVARIKSMRCCFIRFGGKMRGWPPYFFSRVCARVRHAAEGYVTTNNVTVLYWLAVDAGPGKGTKSSITWIETATLNQWRPPPPPGATTAEPESASVEDCGLTAIHQQVRTVDSPLNTALPRVRSNHAIQDRSRAPSSGMHLSE